MEEESCCECGSSSLEIEEHGSQSIKVPDPLRPGSVLSDALIVDLCTQVCRECGRCSELVEFSLEDGKGQESFGAGTQTA